MTKDQVTVGGEYIAMVSDKLVTVRVDRIYSANRFNKKDSTCYDVTNLSTGRKLTFKSAGKFRRLASEAPKGREKVNRTSSGGFPEDGGTGGGPSFLPELPVALKAPRDTAIAPEAGNGSKPVSEDKTAPSPVGLAREPITSKAAYVANPIPLSARLALSNAVPGERKPTEEQNAILAAAAKKPKVLVVTAGAGTGKTTTLRMLADNLKGNGQYTAFNTNLVNESKSKFEGTRVACNTTHSLAFRAVGKNYSHRLGGQRVKSYQIAQTLGIKDFELTLGEETGADGKKKPVTKRLSAGYLAGQVMGAVSRFCQSAETEVQASHFRYIDGIDVPSPTGRTYVNNEKVRAYLLPFAEAAWKDLSNPEGSLPFAHDHYVKVWQLSNPVIAGDYILLDEAQDTAPVMLDVIRRQKSPVIIVGDSAQQIYEWRGAVDALESFPGAPISYLSQSFRFGEAIADVANAILERIVGIELRLKGFPAIPSRVAEVASPTCILCRTNAVAVASLLEALANGKKPFLVGGGAAVVSFVEAAESLQRGETTSHPELACFSSWIEVQEYSKLDEGEDLKLMVKLVDTFGCSKILEALKAMPVEAEANLVISTAHKSKGREWDSVRLANDFPTASKSSDSDLKLLYVAVTRAKLILDVSQCPFFTGQDSMDISEIAARIPKTGEESVLPPTPSTPPAPTEFTWAKDDQTGVWLVKGASGKKGEVVKVVRRDGSESTRRLIDVARQIGPISFYKV